MPFAALLWLFIAACCLQADCCSVCQEDDQTDVSEGQCPVKLTSAPLIEKEKGYSETITLQIWIKIEDFHQCPQIEIHGEHKEVLGPKKKCPRKSQSEMKFRCCKHQKKTSMRKVECVFKAEARRNVSVSYSSRSTNCSVYYLVPAPQPDFSLSVNTSSRTISVLVDSGDPVQVRWCYEKSGHCSGEKPQTTNHSVVLSIPYLLPCVCVEVYYTYVDATRHKKCPFQNESLIDIRDILKSSEVKVFQPHLLWSSVCPTTTKNVSAALCWKMHNHACIPIPDSALQRENEPALKFKTSTVDKHPQMCVQFSVQDIYSVSCLFKAETPSWKSHITPGRQSLSVYITSIKPAKFSAQLCVPTESGCLPRGQIQSEEMATNQRINIPIQDITERPCVQVWQSNPALNGRRILCPDYTHNRWGMWAVGVVTFIVFGTLFGLFIHRATKSGMAGWLTIQRPLLLVSSSDQSTHISAVCALASMLQEELSASVHTALWAQSSEAQPRRKGASVADLGPLPWLYGQWEAICKTRGKILIVWSPEAKRTYQRWRIEKVNDDNNWRSDKIRASVQDYLKLHRWRLGKNIKENKQVEGFVDEDSQKQPSTLIQPVFVAALALLEGALHEGKGIDVALVCFQGLCHSRDIPQAFRGVPRYRLPQEFSGLIQELAEVRGATQSGKLRWHCWSRLLSKVRSVWLARQLTKRLQTVLPQTRAQSVSPSWQTLSDPAESRPKRPLAGTARSRQEQELLPGLALGKGKL